MSQQNVDQRQLVERARRGDRDAFAVLAGSALPRLDAIARLILRDIDRARDAVQEALLRAWRDLPSLREPDRFDAWLYRLLIRACTDEARTYRRRAIEVELTAIHYPRVADGSLSVAERDALERGFMRLDPEQRALIVLHHYLGWPLPEVAATLHIPVGTAKSRLHRALSAMRATLEADLRTSLDLTEGEWV